MDDLDLLDRYAREYDADAFAELVRRHLDLVYRAALRQTAGDPHRAKDIAQTVFCLLARKAGGLSRHPCLAGWLHTTTCHTARYHRREELNRKMREHHAHVLAANGDTAKPIDGLLPVLDGALQELAAKDREAILLRFFRKLSFAEVGIALQTSEDAARVRVARALEKLRHALGRRGIESSVGALAVAMAHEAAQAAPAAVLQGVTACALTVSPAVPIAGLLAQLVAMKTTMIVSGSVIALALCTTAALVNSRRSAQDELAVATRESLAAAVRLDETQTRLRATETAVSPPAVPQPVIAPQPTPQERAAIALGDALFASNPELKALYLRRRKAALAGHFYPLYLELGLNAQQIEAFERLDVGPTQFPAQIFRGKPLMFRPEGWMSPDEALQRVKAILGDAGFRRFQEENTPANRFLTDIGALLAFTDTPLTEGQARDLKKVMVNKVLGEGKRLPEAWTAIGAESGGILSATQLQRLESLRLFAELRNGVLAARQQNAIHAPR